MAVEDYTYHWYLKRDTTGFKIGIINDDGDAVDSDLTLKVIYNRLPDEILTIDDSFLIPDGFRLRFLNGVVDQIIKSYPEKPGIRISKTLFRGKYVTQFYIDYIEAKEELNSKSRRDTQFPTVLRPLDMRYDD